VGSVQVRSSFRFRFAVAERRTPNRESNRRTPNTEHRTANIERRTSNGEHRTANIERRTSNAEHRTANVEPNPEREHEPSTENIEA
jgi:hypothetical protein